MLENMTTGEKVIAGATAVGIAALIFHKPTRNAVGLSDGGLSDSRRKKRGYGTYKVIGMGKMYKSTSHVIEANNREEALKLGRNIIVYDLDEKYGPSQKGEDIMKYDKIRVIAKYVSDKVSDGAKFNNYLGKKVGKK